MILLILNCYADWMVHISKHLFKSFMLRYTVFFFIIAVSYAFLYVIICINDSLLIKWKFSKIIIIEFTEGLKIRAYFLRILI